MKTLIIAGGLFGATAAGISNYETLADYAGGTKGVEHVVTTVATATSDPAQVYIDKPQIDLVFALDTTGSMSGMINAAKEKIWSIASSMANAESAPYIRVGLVAYRDRGDAYVTRVVDLTDDLDSMYATLMEFQAGGGGDHPESVNQALHDAVNNMSWTTQGDAYKVVFLVGDAPGHDDYVNDVSFEDSVMLARQKGIVINTIQCGQQTDTARDWRQIASLGDGQYFQVEQSGSAVAVATPFDEELATLSRELDATRLVYGSAKEREVFEKKAKATTKVHEKASTASRARRAEFNVSASGRANLYGKKDLVDDVASGRVDLSDIDTENLPTEFQSLAAPAAQALIMETATERESLQRQIKTLAEQRQAFIKKELDSLGSAAPSLDDNIYSTIRKQAAEKGLRYDGDSAAY